jgi:hypothetical protein
VPVRGRSITTCAAIHEVTAGADGSDPVLATTPEELVVVGAAADDVSPWTTQDAIAACAAEEEDAGEDQSGEASGS